MKIKIAVFLVVLLIPSSEAITAQTVVDEYPVSLFWQMKLSDQLHIDPAEFKLCQGVHTIGENSRWIWSVFNSITTPENEYWYNPSQHSSLASSYSLILYQSQVQADTDCCTLDNAIQLYDEAQNDYAWDKTYDDLISELEVADSLFMVADTSFMEQHGTENYYKRIRIKAHFEHIVIFVSYPLSRVDTLHHDLKNQKPWFSPCFLWRAYKNSDNSVLSPDNWESAFGISGYLTGITRALIVVDKGQIEVGVFTNADEAYYITKITTPVMLGVQIFDINRYLKKR
jgi:hypothetical protein